MITQTAVVAYPAAPVAAGRHACMPNEHHARVRLTQNERLYYYKLKDSALENGTPLPEIMLPTPWKYLGGMGTSSQEAPPYAVPSLSSFLHLVMVMR